MIHVFISHIPIDLELSEDPYTQEQLTIPYHADITFTDTADVMFCHDSLRPTSHCVNSVETRALRRIKLLPVTRFGGHVDVNC